MPPNSILMPISTSIAHLQSHRYKQTYLHHESKMDTRTKSLPIDPILNLPVQSPVSSICFLTPENSSTQGQKIERHSQDSGDENIDDSDSDSDDDEIAFRSSTIRVKGEKSTTNPKYSNRFLDGRFLASCHTTGEALLWDLQNQKQVATISTPRDGPGTCIRRTDDPAQVLFQTRDPKGIASVHSMERCGESNVDSESNKSTIISQYETHSNTFCRAAPCLGNKHLLALPCSEHSSAKVVDVRANATVAKYSIEKHGMVTSLALSETGKHEGHGNGRPILACGMESGSTTFFDIRNGSTIPYHESSYSIGKEPILALDVIPSNLPDRNNDSSLSSALLVAAGMAGDPEDVAELDEDKAGRAVIFKANSHVDHSSWKFQQRARLSTCRVDRETYSGKPGISVCRFRPDDGRLLAIGGWDKRIRLFERSEGNLVALLKGSRGSIVDLDWAPDAATSGLLASADRDEKIISVWRCFSK